MAFYIMNYVSAVKLWYAGSQRRKSLDTEEPFGLIVCKAGKKKNKSLMALYFV